MNIRDRIVEKRKSRIRREGHTLGVDVPLDRRAPLVPFGRDPFLICEVKRRSPSRGWIARELDAAHAAVGYAKAGVKSLSVLTEQDHFSGSLEDLLRIKEALPETSVLRKDFLLDEEDVEVSWRAGADAVLLIASLLSCDRLDTLYRHAKRRGMAVLLEVHDAEDLRKAAALKPDLVGINSRSLSTFAVDLLHPIGLQKHVEWDARCVFESGIHSQEDARVALSSGFSGLLVGEAAVRDARLVGELLAAFGCRATPFWRMLMERKRPGKPLVKICGICRREDARRAAELGADALGFIFAPSKRRVDASLLPKLADLPVPKVAVVVSEARGSVLPGEVQNLLSDGHIDAVQFHGDEKPEDCYAMAFPYYKALRVKDRRDLGRIRLYRCPRVLLDAFSSQAYGGTGERISDAILSAGLRKQPLWLAGGLDPSNIRVAVERHHPELVDASSGLESEPGIKDPARLTRYFQEIDHAQE